MKAYFINPFERTVTLIDHPGDLVAMYASLQCEMVEFVRLVGDTVLWIDEEGLLMDEPRPFFRCSAAPDHTFSGYGLVLGMNEEGEPQDISYWCEALCPATITFPNLRFTGIQTTEREENHPIFGKVNVINREATFEEIKP